MIMESAIILMAVVGIGLLVGLLISAIRGDMDCVIMFGIAILTGLSTILGLICAIVLAIVFGVRGDSRKALFSVAGFVLGLVLWVGLVALFTAGAIVETPYY